MLLPQFVHGCVYLVDCQIAVDLLHRGAGVLHCVERFLVNVGGFDGVDLLLDLAYLGVGLLEGALVQLFTAEGCFCG